MKVTNESVAAELLAVQARTREQEETLNACGDGLAMALYMREDSGNSPDSMGRKRWRTQWGNKTGLGLVLTIYNELNKRGAK